MKKQTYKKMFNVSIATAMAAGAVVAVAPTQASASVSFSDVKETNGHYTNIMDLANRGVITGYENGTYRPGLSIKRGNAAKIIAGALGLDTVNVKNPGFSDVSTNNSNYGAIAALANAKIISGFEGKYNPNDTLTRGQMSKIIANAFGLTADSTTIPFTDVQNSQYKGFIAALYANEVTTGVTATKFDEKSPVTRGQLASFVVRAEQALQETPATGTTTVDKAATIVSVNNLQVTIDGEVLTIADEVKSVFNASNAAALADSEVTFVVEYPVASTASVTPVANKGKGKIVGVKSMKLVKSGTTFDAKGFAIPTLIVAANNVTVANVKATALEVTAGNTVTLNGVEVTTLTVAKGAKITLGTDTKITTIILPAGVKIEDVIANYAAVKDQLTDVKVQQPSTGGGGGSSSGNTTTPVVPSEAIEKAKDVINDDLKDLKIGSASFDGSTLNIKIANLPTTGDTAGYTVADAFDDKDLLVAAIQDSNILNSVSTVTFDGKTYTAAQAKEMSELELGLIVAGVLGLDENKALEAVMKNKKADLTPYLQAKTTEVTVKFTNGASKTYTVKITK